MHLAQKKRNNDTRYIREYVPLIVKSEAIAGLNVIKILKSSVVKTSITSKGL